MQKSRIGLLIAALLVSLPMVARGQNGTIAPVPYPVFTNATGAVCSGCLLTYYAAGTSTPLTVYSDVTLSTAQAQPITLNAGGRTPLPVYFSANSYKVVLTTALGTTIWTADNVAQVPGATTGVSNTGDITFQVDTDQNGSNKFSFLNGAGTEKAQINESGDLQIDGNLTIGDATAADKALIFDGNTQDYHIGLDDPANTLVIGRGTILGTTPAITVTTSGATTFSGASTFSSTLSVTGATTVGDLRGTVETITATGSVNDQAVGATTTILRFNNATALTLTGLTGCTDGRVLILESIGAGQVNLAHQNASSAAANRLINFVTSGNTPLAAGSGMAELVCDGTTARWRMTRHEQGAWITPTFAAGDYTGSTQPWTVGAGDVATSSYYLKGRQLSYRFYLGTTTVTAGATALNISNAQWGSFTANLTTLVTMIYNDNAAGNTVGLVAVLPAGTVIAIQKLTGTFTASTDNTGVFGEIVFEVN